MSKINMTPITKSDQPTSHLRVGERHFPSSTDLVQVDHRGFHAFFKPVFLDDGLGKNVGMKAYLHENAAELFGGRIDASEDFLVSDAVRDKIPGCKKAKIYAHNVPEQQLAQRLKKDRFLIHPIEEVAHFQNTTARFVVEEMKPSNYSTLLVNEATDFEFSDEPPAPPGEGSPASGRNGGRGRGGGGGGPGRGGPADRDGDPGEMDIDLDLTPTKPTVSLEDDVKGLHEVKETARMLLALFDSQTRSEVEQRYGDEFVERGGSMLLYGPPGCGKTLISEAIAHEAKHHTRIEEEYGDVKFLEVKGGDILSRYPGEAERRVEAIFERGHEIARDGFAVLFFDEVETLVPDRSGDNLQRHERSLTNAFLQEMNDVEDNLLVIGATNMPFEIDPAATRRFRIQQFIPQPDEAVMAEVWETNLESLDTDGAIDYDRLGASSVGYTPAEIADRILGSSVRRELVRSVIEADREAIEPDTDYFLDRLADHEPKTVRQYVTSVRKQVDELEGYPALKQYVEDQADRLGIDRGGAGGRTSAAAERALRRLTGGGDGDRSAASDADADADGGGPDGSVDDGAGSG